MLPCMDGIALLAGALDNSIDVRVQTHIRLQSTQKCRFLNVACVAGFKMYISKKFQLTVIDAQRADVCPMFVYVFEARPDSFACSATCAITWLYDGFGSRL